MTTLAARQILLVLAALVACGALLAGGCDDETGADVAAVDIGGKRFYLELALDNATRVKGLSGRTFIEEDGGMLFVFPRPANQNFVMRDCPIPIDIIFLDATGRIVAMHQMTPEEPRRPDESPDAYERRLKLYPSRFAAQYAIELRGGMLDSLKLSDGQKIELDPSLKSRAK